MTVQSSLRKTLSMTKQSSPRIACIDIGSNAIRLFIAQMNSAGKIRVLEDQRAGVRLGRDAFSFGYIRPVTQNKLEWVMLYFRDICDRLEVTEIHAVGTSAMRDARNHAAIIEGVKARTGISIHVISGQREASLVFKSISQAVDLSKKRSLLIDMGGGSLELILSQNGKITKKISIPVGTVRLLSKGGIRPTYEDFARWVRTPLYRMRVELLGLKQNPIELTIGTGGNLRALGKLCWGLELSRSRGRFSREDLEALVLPLFKMSFAQRMQRYLLRKDRADVILPASVVVLELMRIFEVREIIVPNVGLKNGLFWESLDKI